MEIPEKLQGILNTLPPKPGCYIMKNTEGTAIYVGKAISLKNRARSNFHADASLEAKTRRLVREIADIEWIVVGSELEALILEMNLIKKHRPKYNVRLKDDKRYPYIKIHWTDPFPKVTVTRHSSYWIVLSACLNLPRHCWKNFHQAFNWDIQRRRYIRLYLSAMAGDRIERMIYL